MSLRRRPVRWKRFLSLGAYVSGLELGQRNPTVVTLWHAAQALEIEVHLLLKN